MKTSDYQMNDVASIKIISVDRITVANIEYFAKEIDRGIAKRLILNNAKSCNICMFKRTPACKVSKDNLLCLDKRADSKKIYWARYHE